jgi:membrane protein implicated in regulation of membrane protease activity
MLLEGINLYYSIALGIGILLAIVSLLGHEINIGIESITVACFTTLLGGMGLVMGILSDLTAVNLLISVLVAVIGTVFTHLVIVPMKKTESSLGYELESLEGTVAKVITAIPEVGVGEILIQTKFGNQVRRAKSLDKKPISERSNVVIVKVGKDQIFSVSKINTIEEELETH